MLFVLSPLLRSKMGLRKLYVFGNEFLKDDSFALRVAEGLSGVDVVHCRRPDELMDEEGELLILDVIKGTDNIRIIKDIDEIKTRNLVSMHDFDLGFFLSLMKELGSPKKIKIIGIPEKGEEKEICKKVEQIINNI
ncbi:hypothetical protein D6745_04995 [Candidatus Woesearchaeota archaeon]|nr:MAG: hypothetical protein D6745_04995 [Candidatus Woesearchaeota archaeon]